MSKRFVGRYFLIYLLSALLAGSAVAQNSSRNRRKQNTETPENDTTRTLTHSVPIANVYSRTIPPRKKFLIGHPDDSYQIGVGAFIDMTMDTTRAVFVPSITAKPFVRICDKYIIGVNANAIVQNYAGEKFSPVVNEIFLTSTLQTKIGDFNIKIGKMLAINYPHCFAESVPVGNYMMNRFNFDSRRYLPSAAIATFTSDITAFGIGYAENTKGFGFAGNGYVLMTVEQRFGDNFELGGFVLTNKRESYGDAYLAFQPTGHDAVVLQLLDLGGQSTFYGLYKHTLKNNEAAFSINGFVQSHDGPAGADITFQHIKSGTYVSAGAHYNDPLHITHGEPTKWRPFVQIGINKTLFPRKIR